jgi:maltooligosyltrehalose trehalohydrolase
VAKQTWSRRLPIGAEVQPDGGVHFRVWAPRRKKVAVAVHPPEDAATSHRVEMESGAGGYYEAFVPQAAAGWRYYFLLDEEDYAYPDPASRFQPEGVHGASEVIDPSEYAWSDVGWKGASLPGQILYEMHLGTFTPEGTCAAAMERLPHLADLGVTLLEIMPLAEFPGEFGWGYDGAAWFAPTRLYGRPDDFRRFVDEAHRLGLGVTLDVIYNHFGPCGNYTGAFSEDYVSRQRGTEWGDAINFDGPNSEPVREFVSSNAAYWIDEFHLDGLRLDAVHAIVDESPEHVLALLQRRARQAAGAKSIVIYAEDEHQRVRMVQPPEDLGCGLDGVWNDDFHHSARVAATGHAEYYYGDYAGTPQELISAVKWGYLYQGQWHGRQQKFRGTPTWRQPAARFVTYLQNHDQVANSAHGLRLHELTSPGRFRALTTLLLLSPNTPLLFQGEEFAASAPFLFFADHEVDLARLVREGRWEFLRHFNRVAGLTEPLPGTDPESRRSFERCILDWSERESHARTLDLHRDLIRLRKSDRVFSSQDAGAIHGAVIGPEAFLLRYLGQDGGDRLLLVNLGRDLEWRPAAEPLMAPPAGHPWRLLFSSEEPRYGGTGTALLDIKNWRIPGHAAIALASE